MAFSAEASNLEIFRYVLCNDWEMTGILKDRKVKIATTYLLTLNNTTLVPNNYPLSSEPHHPETPTSPYLIPIQCPFDSNTTPLQQLPSRNTPKDNIKYATWNLKAA